MKNKTTIWVLICIYIITLISFTWKYNKINESYETILIKQQIKLEKIYKNLETRLYAEKIFSQQKTSLQEITREIKTDIVLFIYIPLSTCDDCNALIYDYIFPNAQKINLPICILTPSSKIRANKLFFSKYKCAVKPFNEKESKTHLSDKPILFLFSNNTCKHFLIPENNAQTILKNYFKYLHETYYQVKFS